MKKIVKKAIDFIRNFQASSAERPQDFDGFPRARYAFALRWATGKKILDIGCGLGQGAHKLAKGGAREVVGIDYSRSAIAEAKRRHHLPNLEFSCRGAGDLKTMNAIFDMVIAFEIVEHLGKAETEKMLSGAASILKKNGVFLLSTPNKLKFSPGRVKPWNPYHTKEYLVEDLRTLLGKYFREVRILGLKCADENYLQAEKALREKSIRHFVSKRVGRSKIARNIAAFVPPGYRQKITGESKLPKVGIKDSRISDSGIGEVNTLLAVCGK
jgi:2-polyprenyl-3-methyl-5-hydroxy-6-metoxy-1,4-benzoquinol methylase